MKCSCPKCSSNINIDDPSVPEKGHFSRCPDCDSRFWTHRESFLQRAYKKDWKAFCHHCGEEVGAANYCQSCYQPFPDYWVVQASRPARRKTSYKADFSISLPGFQFKKTKTVEKIVLSPKEKEELSLDEGLDLEPEKKAGAGLNPLYVKGVALVIVVALIIGGIQLFSGTEQHEVFKKDYIRILYAISAGADKNIEKLTQMSSGTPLSSQDAQQLQRIYSSIEKYRQKVAVPPEQFASSIQDLEGVYEAYAALYSLAVSTSVVTADFQTQLEISSAKLDEAEQKLKSGLPSDLREEIKAAIYKYPSLHYIED